MVEEKAGLFLLIIIGIALIAYSYYDEHHPHDGEK